MDEYDIMIAIEIITVVILLCLWFFAVGNPQATMPTITQEMIDNASHKIDRVVPTDENTEICKNQTESIVITETQTPSPTPALWNGTRRESVGLPVDRNRCCHPPCTPTPTPTGTPVPEFPCPLRSGC